MNDMKGKAALITGGGTGVGRATALQLAQLGCHVAVTYSKSEQAAEATAAEVGEHGVQSLAIRADVADDAACRAAVAEVVARFGRLDILVQCAGITEFIGFDDLDRVTDEVWQRLFQVNVVGAFH